jgi:hypothetical protein
MTVLDPNNVTFKVVKEALQLLADHHDHTFYLLDHESMIVEDDSGFKLEVILYGENNIISMKCSSVAYKTNSIEHAYLVCNHLNMNVPFTRFCCFELPSPKNGMEIIVRTSNDTLYDNGLHVDQFLYNANYFLKSSKKMINDHF